MDLAFILGLMGENMKGNGKIIRCMVKENTLGQMVDFTKVNIKTMKKMDMEYIFGEEVKSMKGTGKMAFGMDRASILCQMERVE